MMKNEGKEYIKLIRNAIVFGVLVIVFDQLIGGLLRRYYFSSTSGDSFKANYSMDKTKEDIIILGSSRANHHYLSKMIQDSTGMTCYNTGRDGHFLFYSYAIFTQTIRRYNPKLFILDISPEDIYKEARFYEGLRSLLPYYVTKPDLRNLIERKSPLERVKLLSAIYPFNSSLISLIKNNLVSEKDSLNGYEPLYGISIFEEKGLRPLLYVEKDFEIDSFKIRILREIATTCKNRNIKLLVVNSPNYPDDDFPKAEAIVKNIVEKENAVFFTFRGDSLFQSSPQFYKGRIHLNVDGADHLTRSMIPRIQNILGSKTRRLHDEL